MKSCHFEIGRKVIAAHYSHYRSFVSFRSAYLACLVAVFVYITSSSGSSCQLACHPAAGTVISSVSQTSAGRPASVPLRPSTQTVDGMLGIISSSSSHILRRHKGPRGSWLAYGAFQWVETWEGQKRPKETIHTTFPYCALPLLPLSKMFHMSFKQKLESHWGIYNVF